MPRQSLHKPPRFGTDRSSGEFGRLTAAVGVSRGLRRSDKVSIKCSMEVLGVKVVLDVFGQVCYVDDGDDGDVMMMVIVTIQLRFKIRCIRSIAPVLSL